MVMPRKYKVSGLISGIEPTEEGYTRITLQPIDGGCKEVRIVFFNNVGQSLNGRVIDYREREIPLTSLTQIITGDRIDLNATVSWKAVERFRSRAEFIPRKEKTL